MKAFGRTGIMDINIHVYWGVKDIDKSDASMWDAHYIGEVLWDDSFDLYPKDAQMSLVNFCQELRSEKASHIVLDSKASCWIDTFENWYKLKNKIKSDKSIWPLEPTQFKTELNEFVKNSREGKNLVNENKLGFKNDVLVFF